MMIINRLALLAQASSPIDRWRGMRNSGGSGGYANLLWWTLVALGLLAVVGLIASLIHLRRRERRKWARFAELCRQPGLREREIVLLERLARHAGMKDPGVIFADEDAFNAAALGFLTAQPVAALPDRSQFDLQNMMISVHAKLGFGAVDEGDELDIIRSSRRIEIGSKVFISPIGDRKSVKATVTANSRTELVLTADQEPTARRDGDELSIQYARGRRAWEFDVRVIQCDGHKVSVEHSNELRAVNFRRFPRVPTKMSATGTTVPFHVDSCDAPMEFMDVDIREIAGPGLLVKLPASVEIGQQILLRVQLGGDKSVQGLTKVRRIVTDRSGGPYVAVEFIELDEAGIAELTRATNLAAGTADRADAAGESSPKAEMAVV